MTITMLCRVAAAVGVIAFTSAAFAQQMPTCQGPGETNMVSGFSVPPNSGVALSQLTFSFDNVSSVEPSATGEVDVSPTDLIDAAGLNGFVISNGFVNIMTSAGWVVENLPILPGYPYMDISTRFNLGATAAGTVVPNLPATVCYTPDPLVGPPMGTSYSYTMPPPIGYNAQGECPDDNKDAACLVAADPPPPAIGIQFPGGLFSFKVQP